MRVFGKIIMGLINEDRGWDRMDILKLSHRPSVSMVASIEQEQHIVPKTISQNLAIMTSMILVTKSKL